MQADGLIGRQLGDYRIEARIGRGGMAKIYRAYQPSVQRHVAVKIVSTDLADERDLNIFRERFAREAKVIASLEHTHILPIYDYGIVDDTAYLVMRLLDGGSLSDIIAEGPLELERAADIFGQVARGLAYAHSKGIIHRDLKPANILFSSTGDAYLTDFGLAKWIEGTSGLTQSGKIVGTPAYMSPEQLRGEPIDQRADIYAMGVILYQMVTGELPFDSDTGDVVSIIYQHLERNPPSPRELNPKLPAAVEGVILRALQKNAAQRYNSVLQMADELYIALGMRPQSGTSDPLPTPALLPVNHRRGQPRNRHWWVVGGLSVLVLALLALVVLLIVRSQPGELIPPLPTIQVGMESPAAELLPTSEQIAMAQRVLGDRFIAFITCLQSTEYHATQAREMGDFARAYGLNYRVYDSNNDSYAQITQIERARTDGAGAIIICPLDSELLEGALSSVQAAHLPLVVMSSESFSYGGVVLSGDEYEMGFRAGQLAGQIIAEEMGGQADVIVLDYPILERIVTRANGLVDGVLSKAPGATIVGRYLGATPDNGEQSVRQLIEQGVRFNVIVSINDAGSFGAIKALEAANIPPDDVVITSIDADQTALRYIREGRYLRGSLDIGRELFSRTAINAVIKLLSGGTVTERVLVPPEDMITAANLRSLPRPGIGAQPD
jgi:ABC-type sugar transport system substrate-binding protein/tRNA A-37 threonylcarbamoyl transferase component Bud32